MTQPDPAPLVASLNRRHNRLAADMASGSWKAADVDALLSDIAAAGAVVPPGPDRDGLRNLLYFWASDRTIRGHAPGEAPLPTLAPFTGIPALQSQPTVTGAELQDSVDGRTTTSAGPPSDIEARAIVRIASLARQWRLSDDASKTGYLLTGKALVEASLFVDRDPDIADLVAASEVQEKETERKQRQTKRWLRTLEVIAALAAITWGISAWLFYYDRLVFVADDWFRHVNAARSATRDDNRTTAQQAVEGLNRDDLGPLRQLLEQRGGASANELKRLELAAATPVERAAAATFITPPRGGEPPKLAPGEVTCSGYLWFGAKGDSRLDDGRDPGSLKDGDSVTLNRQADIRLRKEWPSDIPAYVLAPPIGLVPAGAQVKLSSAPKSYSVGTTEQIWAEVSVPGTYCTTVFLFHYFNKDPERGRVGDDHSDAVLDAVRKLGAQTPLRGEKYDGAQQRAQVRFFWPQDELVAGQVAKALSRFNNGKPLAVDHVRGTPIPPVQGSIEIWLHFER
jgi:hypothetical protein